MFRFSVDQDVPLAAGTDQLVTAGITEDEDFAQRLRNTGEYQDDERYFRVENVSPHDVKEAVEYVQRVIGHAPERVWIGGAAQHVSGDVLRNVRKPGR